MRSRGRCDEECRPSGRAVNLSVTGSIRVLLRAASASETNLVEAPDPGPGSRDHTIPPGTTVRVCDLIMVMPGRPGVAPGSGAIGRMPGARGAIVTRHG